ncbi:MAG: hypothetical protein RIR51_1914 [Bacteroidota bacterium]|jgi:deoxyribodipyrimidine photo-lyase
MEKINLFWFRRDLRLFDNHGLYESLRENKTVLPIFIFDPSILENLQDLKDPRVSFIYQELEKINHQLQLIGSSILVLHKKPLEAFQFLIQKFSIENVYTNHDYEGYAIQRDSQIKEFLSQNGIGFKSFKDQVIFEKKEILSGQNTPYTVFTPYSRKWKEVLNQNPIINYPSENYSNFYQENFPFPKLESIGFNYSDISIPTNSLDLDLVRNYENTRDIPSINGTTRLSVHLRFGTVSIRKLVQSVMPVSEKYLNELIWRDFYFNITYNFPHINQGHSFRKEYDFIQWDNNEILFEAWKNGQTGFPIIDAGMRELNTTGHMHNRVRMIVSSFLIKDLLIDWRWGEAYFAEKLLDYEFSSNNGGWQWAAGSGCDAAPYFRVFNPSLQTQKFDPDLKYIKKWVPEFQEFTYPRPIVDHDIAKKRVVERYKEGLAKAQ